MAPYYGVLEDSPISVSDVAHRSSCLFSKVRRICWRRVLAVLTVVASDAAVVR